MAYPYIVDPVEEFRALALAYVQGQDLTDCTPEEILDMYSEALDSIHEHYKKNY